MGPTEPDPVEKLMGEELLLRLLELPPSQWSAACASVCARHPEHERTLADRLQWLVGAGVLPAPDRPVAPGERRLGPYELLSQLGSGGQGVVFLAEDTRLRRRVALKVLSHAAALSQRARQRLRREAEILSKLDHPDICTVFEIGDVDDTPYIAMRWVDGETLANRLARGETTTTSGARAARAAVAHAVRLIERAARALHVAHEAGIVHRDIKPGNVMVTRAGDPVLLDFGLASDESSDGLTGTGDVLGTPAYMSPEQVEHLPLDRRTDVYSLAATLYECLTGHRPFEAPTREAMYRAITSGVAPPARRWNADIAPDLEVVLATALESDRDRRYQTALDFAADLAAVLESRPIRARRASALGKLVRWSRRRPAQAALAALALVAVPTIATLGGYLWASLPDLAAQRAARHDAQVEAELERGYAELGDRHYARAARRFAAAAALAPQRPDVIGALACVELRQQRVAPALAVLDAHRDLAATAPWLEWVRVFALRTAGDAAAAAGLEARLGSPDGELACFFAGQCRRYFGGEDAASPRLALDLFTRAILLAKRPRALFYMARAEAANLAGDEAAGRQTADALVALWPDSSCAFDRAALALGPFDLERAIRCARRAVELDPSWATAAHNLGVALGRAGDHAASAAAFRRAVRLEPDNAEDHYCLGCSLDRAGETAAALAAYRRAVELYQAQARIDDHCVAAHINYGSTLIEQGDLDAAEDVFRGGLAIDERCAAFHYHLGRLAEVRGETREAAALFARTVELEPRESEAHEHLLAALLELGDEAAVRAERERWAGLPPEAEREGK